MPNEQILEKARFPRPDFIRRDFISLDGEWEFSFCSQLEHPFPEGWQDRPLPGKILVPFSYTCNASGIRHEIYEDCVCYARDLIVQENKLSGEALLKFGAADYCCDVWINDAYAGSHQGGHTQFEFPVASYLHPGKNRIFLRVRDDRTCDRPRGKQYWKDTPDRCWYPDTIGIWKSVWLEFVPKKYIKRVKLAPDTDNRCLKLEAYLNESFSGTLKADIFFHDTLKKTAAFSLTDTHYICETLHIAEEDFVDEVHYWSCEKPNLYHLSLFLSETDTLEDDTEEYNTVIGDTVECYFGMRKIETREGKVFLNNRLLFQRLVLDQGYWKDSLMTPPSKDALKQDIHLTKMMGFNGARKHQKLEDPFYYYWADVTGLLVWCEMPSPYQFNDCEISSFLSEWQEIICEAYNHPGIITWVPFNESWGIRNVFKDQQQQNLLAAAYHLTKAYDPTRLISTNDGWEVPNETDIFCIHDYEGDADTLRQRYQNIEAFSRTGIPNRPALTQPSVYRSQPFFLSEYGGVALSCDSSEESWGYNEFAETFEEYVQRVKALTETAGNLPGCCGYCYTQLTDVFQEVNGLLTAKREPKVPFEMLKKIFL